MSTTCATLAGSLASALVLMLAVGVDEVGELLRAPGGGDHPVPGRVDRIAVAAGSNKAQIYHYFDSKDGLFDAVFHDLVGTTLRDTPIDPSNLPEYAGRLYDCYVVRPHVQRLATWYRRERAATRDPIAIVIESNRPKIDAVAKAQAEGVLSDRWSAVDLLGLVLHVSGLWTGTTPEYAALVADADHVHRRAVVVDAVRALLAGRSGSGRHDDSSARTASIVSASAGVLSGR